MITADWIFLIVVAFLIGYWIGGRRARRAWMIEAEAQILSLRESYTDLYETVRERDKKQVQQAVTDFKSKAQEYIDERSASKKASGDAVLAYLAGHLESNQPDNTFDLARFRQLQGVMGFGADFFDCLSSLPKTATRQEAAARIRELVEQKVGKP